MVSDDVQLYSHQAVAIDAAVADHRDVIISTSTGSGKSLVYLAAVFEALIRDPEAAAVLIFPTKALAQDQLRALGRLTAALARRGIPEEELTCACLDGDTPQQERARVRRNARIVLTNPDMLHSHILPRHTEYSRLLGSLRYVVLDEVHVYRGAFGAHTASVLRRLRRLAGDDTSNDFLGRGIHFVACSATVANPGEHFERLLGPRAERPMVITEDGSPSGARLHVLWNPELLPSQVQGQMPNGLVGSTIKAENPLAPSVPGSGGAAEEAELDSDEARSALAGSRRSPIVEVARLLAWLVARGLSVLAFCKWRSLVEIILQDVRDALAASGQPEAAARVVSYRAGYPPATRRELERRIFTREALGVACTNALELGVDIGRLDCTISLGFPGSIASLRQQFGRAGRAGRPGLSFFVAWDDPTDQHLVRNPKELLARRPEAVALAPANPVVLRAHMPCAAVEQPLQPSDASLWAAPSAELAGPDMVEELPAQSPWDEAVQQCLSEGSLERQPGGDGTLTVPHARRAFGGPHKKVAIRSVEVRYEVVAERSDRCRPMDTAEAGGFVRPSAANLAEEGSAASSSVIDEVDESKAFYSLFPGSVYRLRGEEYHIVDLNLQRRRATARKCEAPLPYYTRAYDSTVFRILTRERRFRAGGAKICCGGVERESRVKSFRRYWKAQDVPHETEVELDLPSWGVRTRGLWFETNAVEQAANSVAAAEAAQGMTWAGAHAAMHALLRVFPLFVLAERSDLDAACVDEHGPPPMDQPRLLIYDSQHGGLGLCDEAFPHAAAMLREARRLVEGCPCEDGCPSCIVDPRCLEYNRLLSKLGALTWLRGLEGNGAGSASEASDSGMEE